MGTHLGAKGLALGPEGLSAVEVPGRRQSRSESGWGENPASNGAAKQLLPPGGEAPGTFSKSRMGRKKQKKAKNHENESTDTRECDAIRA